MLVTPRTINRKIKLIAKRLGVLPCVDQAHKVVSLAAAAGLPLPRVILRGGFLLVRKRLERPVLLACAKPAQADALLQT